MRFRIRSAMAASLGLAALWAATALAQPAQGTPPAAGGTVTRDDNSTTPVTVWYVDQNGYMVRIQPLD